MRLSQGAQPTDAVRTLLEKGGLLDKKARPAEVIGKVNQEKARQNQSKADNKKEAPKESSEAKDSD